MLAAQLGDRRAQFRLLQDAGDLFDQNRFFFTTRPPSVRLDSAPEFTFELAQFYRGRQQSFGIQRCPLYNDITTKVSGLAVASAGSDRRGRSKLVSSGPSGTDSDRIKGTIGRLAE
jgi:hypothetical protein